MSIEIHWFATLVKRTKSRQAVTTAGWTEGLTPQVLFIAEGFSEADAEHVLVTINNEQAEMATPLTDGDRVDFLVSIQGG